MARNNSGTRPTSDSIWRWARLLVPLKLRSVTKTRQPFREHFRFIGEIYHRAMPEVKNAVHVSYLECLGFDGKHGKRIKAKEMLSPELQARFKGLEAYNAELFGRKHGARSRPRRIQAAGPSASGKIKKIQDQRPLTMEAQCMRLPVIAGNREVARDRAAAMLAGDDLVDFDRHPRPGLWQAAVFATAFCSLPYQPFMCSIHA